MGEGERLGWGSKDPGRGGVGDFMLTTEERSLSFSKIVYDDVTGFSIGVQAMVYYYIRV